MALRAGERLGPYEILGGLGAGGMGEVYRARDPRLGRAVAIKVLRPEAARDPERLRRFEQEARASGGLSHPNIVAVHDVGSHEGAPYLVTELLEGETLRQRLETGALPVRKAIDCALQTARGLAAAHERQVVHRDLKPENLFLTKDGIVKILDFGLARLERRPREPDSAATATVTDGTDPGTVMGTVGYMSPEQVRGEAADHRCDIFALGAVLYEMLTGRRAFHKGTSVETLNAILKEEPPEFPPDAKVPPALDRFVRHCLEKKPEDRFQSAKDVAFAIEAESAPGSGLVVVPTKRWRPWQEWVLRGGLVAAIIAALAGAVAVGRWLERKPVPAYRQLTFRRGIVDRSRFAPDGQTVVYGARWEGKPSEVFAARLDLAEAQALSLAQNARVDALHGGEALIHYPDGRLARMPLVGGTPRDVAENIDDSDWGPTGDIAVVRSQPLPKVRFWLEYPIGKTLLESSSERSPREPRVSPAGDRVALIEGLNEGSGTAVVVIDRSGQRTILSSGWMEVSGLAWSPDGREVWFTAGGRGGVGSVGTLKELHAVSLAGRERLLLRMAGDLTLRDVFRDGRVLLSHGRMRCESRGRLAGDEKEHDLTYLDGTVTVGISADGRAVLFQEAGQAGGPQCTSYLRRVGDAGPIRLGEGWAVALSPDGRHAIAGSGSVGQVRLTLLSAGAEPPRELSRVTLNFLGWAFWTPDGQRVIFYGTDKDRVSRSYILQPPDGQPQPISPEGMRCRPASHGWAFCWHDQENQGRAVPICELRSLDGSETLPISWTRPDECCNVPVAWSTDGRHVFVAGKEEPPFRVFRVDVATGRREPWLDTSPPDAAGVGQMIVLGAALTPDGRYYAYSYFRTLSDLFLVEGLR